MPENHKKQEITADTDIRLSLRNFIVILIAAISLTSAVILFFIQNSSIKTDSLLPSKIETIEKDIKNIKDSLSEISQYQKDYHFSSNSSDKNI